MSTPKTTALNGSPKADSLSIKTSLSNDLGTGLTTELQVAPAKAPSQKPAKSSDRVCWVEEKRSPLQADHQVELLHLQAEADALLIKLQSAR